jgi:hypothetical protein
MTTAAETWEAGAARFFRAWSALPASGDASTARFFHALRPLLRDLDPPGARAKIAPDPARLARAFAALAGPLRAIRSEGAFLNPWAVAGLRQEVQVCAALAALWNPALAGPGARDFLAAFLAQVRGGGSPLPDAGDLAAGYRIRVEDSPLGLASERIDVTVEGERFLIGIEVKIGAALQPRQLERYVDTVTRRAAAGGQVPHVILLAPFPPRLAGVGAATWRDVALAAEASLPPVRERGFAHRLLETFAAHVRTF